MDDCSSGLWRAVDVSGRAKKKAGLAAGLQFGRDGRGVRGLPVSSVQRGRRYVVPRGLKLFQAFFLSLLRAGDLRPATMPTTAPATLPATEATPLATEVAPVTRAPAAPLPLGAFAAPPALDPLVDGLADDFAGGVAAGREPGLDGLEALAFRVVEVLAALGAEPAVALPVVVLGAGLPDFPASLDRSAIAAPAPVPASSGLLPDVFFTETALLMWIFLRKKLQSASTGGVGGSSDGPEDA